MTIKTILAFAKIDNKSKVSYKKIMKTDLYRRIKNYQEISREVGELRKQGKAIVFVNGCFDVLHFAHALFLEKAKKFGNVLVVGIASDKVIKKVKGEMRPIYPEKIRAGLVASLSVVDLVVIMKENLYHGVDFHKLIAKIKPDVMVLNDDNSDIPTTRRLVKKYGGQLRLVPRQHPTISTTTTIKKISEI